MTMKKILYNFTPGWVSGITQADGSFLVVFSKQLKSNIPYRPRPSFVLVQTIRELEMMKALHSYLKVGYLRISGDCVYLIVDNRKDLINVIIPLFDTYTLQGSKFVSYLIFRQVVFCMENKMHLQPEGFLAILHFCYFMHGSTLRSLESKQLIIQAVLTKFPGVSGYPPIMIDFSITANKDLTVDFISGLVDGDGSIGFNFPANKNQVGVVFMVTQGIEDYSLLLKLLEFFGCGRVVISTKKEAADFIVSDTRSLITNILPVLEKMHLNTVKQTYVDPSIQAWYIIHNGIKTREQLMDVVELVYNMNQGGKMRNMSKEAYVAQIKSFKSDKKA